MSACLKIFIQFLSAWYPRAAYSRAANSFCFDIFELKFEQISSLGIKLHLYGT